MGPLECDFFLWLSFLNDDFIVTIVAPDDDNAKMSESDVKKRSLDEGGEATKKDTDKDSSSPSVAKKAKVDLDSDKASSKPTTEKATEKKAENGDHRDTDKDEVAASEKEKSSG